MAEPASGSDNQPLSLVGFALHSRHCRPVDPFFQAAFPSALTSLGGPYHCLLLKCSTVLLPPTTGRSPRWMRVSPAAAHLTCVPRACVSAVLTGKPEATIRSLCFASPHRPCLAGSYHRWNLLWVQRHQGCHGVLTAGLRQKALRRLRSV